MGGDGLQLDEFDFGGTNEESSVESESNDGLDLLDDSSFDGFPEKSEVVEEEFPQETRHEERSEKKFPAETLNTNEHKIKIPGIEDIPDYINFLATLNTKQNAIEEIQKSIHFDLDKMDPKAANEQIKKLHKDLSLDAAIYEYLESKEFKDINLDELLEISIFKDLELTDVADKIDYIQNTVNRLSQNDYCIENEPFLKKLYKLKRIEVLVNDSIQVNSVHAKQSKLKENLVGFLKKYSSFVEKDVNKNLNSILLSIQKEESSSEKLEAVQKENNDLKDKLTKTVDEDIYQDKVKECEELEQKLEELTNELNSSKSKDDIKIDSSFIKKHFPNLEINESFSVEDILNHISEKLEAVQKENNDLKDKLTKTVDEDIYQDKVKECEELEQKLEELTNELNSSNENKYQEVEEEKEFPQETENEDKKVKKPMSKALKITLIVVSTIVFIIVTIFGVGSYLLSEEEQVVNNTNYAPAPVKQNTEPTKVMENIKLEPKKIEKLETTPVYDFNKIMSFDEFEQQKFDIYSDNFEKIRINKKDFVRGDVINGFKFIKANSEGKILFIDDKNNPLWVKMK
jgi:preprotein translocase subunit SecE